MEAATPACCVPDNAERPAIGRLVLQHSTEGDCAVVRVAGELDAASRGQLVVASTAGDHPTTVIDLAGVTFMDCSGYGSLEASRGIVERDGRTFTTRGQIGQPARLFELIAALDDHDDHDVHEVSRGLRARCPHCG